MCVYGIDIKAVLMKLRQKIAEIQVL